VDPRGAGADLEKLRAERVAAIGGMAVALAHEINQPFLATVAYLETARARLREAEPDARREAAAALDLATEQIMRAGQIIKHLREFASSGEPDKTFRRLHDVVRLAAAFMGQALARQAVEVVLRLDAPRDRVLIDAVQIKQVLINLIRNAEQAMRERPTRRLVISTALDGDDMIRVDVTDTGAGLSAEIRERLFEPFHTTKEGGMGIGLAISQTIVEAHYGKLRARPNPDGGAIFSFTLPLEGESADA
jgi:C4-dicarboxylate-specific signal transduction histidine kinase